MLSFPFVQKIKSKSTIWYLFPSIWFVLHTNRQWSIFMASGIKPRLFSHSKLLLEQNISKENFKSFPKLWDDLTFFSAHSVFFSNDLMFKVCNFRKKNAGLRIRTPENSILFVSSNMWSNSHSSTVLSFLITKLNN